MRTAAVRLYFYSQVSSRCCFFISSFVGLLSFLCSVLFNGDVVQCVFNCLLLSLQAVHSVRGLLLNTPRLTQSNVTLHLSQCIVLLLSPVPPILQPALVHIAIAKRLVKLGSNPAIACSFSINHPLCSVFASFQHIYAWRLSWFLFLG